MTIDAEKDDLATQEMIAMLDDLPTDDTPLETDDEISVEIETASPTEESQQADDLLDALEDLPTMDEPEMSVDTVDTIEDTMETAELTVALDEAPLAPELETDATDKAEPEEHETVEDTANTEQVNEDIDPLAEEASVEEVRESLPENLDELPTDIEAEIEEDLPILPEVDANTPTVDEETHVELDPPMTQTSTETTSSSQNISSDAITQMEEAIALDADIQTIAESVHTAAQEAVKIALATAKKAQEHTAATHAAIESTFSATERAFETAKKAGYELDLEALKAPISEEAIQAQLNEIKQKNATLRATNENLKIKVASIITQ